VQGAQWRSTSTPTYLMADRSQPHGQRNLIPAWWALDGFAIVPTAALDPHHRAASPAVPALVGSGSPDPVYISAKRKVVSGLGQVPSSPTGVGTSRGLPRNWSSGTMLTVSCVPLLPSRPSICRLTEVPGWKSSTRGRDLVTPAAVGKARRAMPSATSWQVTRSRRMPSIDCLKIAAFWENAI